MYVNEFDREREQEQNPRKRMRMCKTERKKKKKNRAANTQFAISLTNNSNYIISRTSIPRDTILYEHSTSSVTKHADVLTLPHNSRDSATVTRPHTRSHSTHTHPRSRTHSHSLTLSRTHTRSPTHSLIQSVREPLFVWREKDSILD